MSIERQGVKENNQGEPSKTPSLGILSGLGSGLCWGVSAVLLKSGIEEIGSPSAAAVISFGAASIVIASTLLRRELRGILSKIDRSSLTLFVIAGVLSATAQLFRFTAFSFSPVSVVTPIVSSEVVLVLLFSFFLNRNLEVFTWRIIVGMIAAVAGVILLST